ncbi:MAG: tetratricopeptide repeat protein [Anaerolineales bacterium]
MEAAEQQQLLRAGIEAIRAGERERGREMLLRVVEADSRVEPAWLWLASALDDPSDKITALENALTLNPRNTAARQQLAALRGEPLPAPAAVPAAEPAPTLPPAPIFTGIDPDDDPLQCPYCGQFTDEADERCAHCRRSLLKPGKWQGGGYLYVLYLVVGLATQAAIAETFMPLIVNSLREEPGLVVLLNGLRLGDGLVSVPLGALAIRALLFLMLFGLFLADKRIAFTLAAVTLPVDMAVNGAAWWYGWLPQTVAVVNLGLSATLWLIAVAALISQSLARERIYTRADGALVDAPSLRQRALEHARQKQWALAAAHLKRAIARSPKHAPLYRDLAMMQMQLGRYPQAKQSLESGLALKPGDGEMRRMMQAIENR